MPHFNRIALVRMYVKKLLVCFHGGYLWLDKPYEVTIELVLAITGLPQQGVDLTPYLQKDTKKLDKNNMKGKYQLVYDRKGYLISSIDDIAITAAAKILCSKVLRKMRPTECTAATIELEEQCA